MAAILPSSCISQTPTTHSERSSRRTTLYLSIFDIAGLLLLLQPVFSLTESGRVQNRFLLSMQENKMKQNEKKVKSKETHQKGVSGSHGRKEGR